MSTPTVGVVPLDDRSVNYECLQMLGDAAGFEVVLPPKAWLGTPWRAGSVEHLGMWLTEVAPRADALIVAVDTLGYGGLVNSRCSPDATEDILQRLERLRSIKQAHPGIAILAFNVLMRITRSNNAEEEKAYWADYGARMFRLSYLEDRAEMAVGAPEESKEITALRAVIPPTILTDYLAGRERNHTVNRRMIEWTAAGIIDYLIIAQDDTVEYGWNIAEARALRRYVAKLGIVERVSIYPGTDETAMLLLARYAAQRASFTPRVRLRYSGGNQVVTAYEDRPMTEMVKAHLGPLGGIVCDDPASADISLYVNAPAEVQGNGPDQYILVLTDAQIAALPPASQAALNTYRQQADLAPTLREMHTVRRNLPEFVRALSDDLFAGRTCAVADVAFVNAGDLALGELLTNMANLSELSAYGGWNTAGNTLGCVLAHAVIRHLQRLHRATPQMLAGHVRFLFMRLVEDLLYMAHLRTQIAVEELPEHGLSPTLGDLGAHVEAVRAVVEQKLREAAAQLAQTQFLGRSLTAEGTQLRIEDLALADVHLPWGRLFDLTMAVEIGYAVD